MVTQRADLCSWLYIRKRVAVCSFWVRRYFVLTDGFIRCYTSPSSATPSRVIKLSLFTAIASEFSKTSPRLMLSLKSPTSSESFIAKDSHTFHSWLEALNDYFKENQLPTKSWVCNHKAKQGSTCELCLPSRLNIAELGAARAPLKRFSISFKPRNRKRFP